MISSIAWIPAGVADPHPKKYEMSKTELELIAMMEKQSHITAPTEDAASMAQAAAKRLTGRSPQVDANSLPADLRMDEYSDDDDENERGVAISQVLMTPLPDIMEQQQPQDDDESEDDDNKENDQESMSENDDSDDDDDDDDLVDIPDTREYTPVDIEGLQSMGISLGGANDDESEDDESEAEDVMLTSADAIVLVAKTEDDFASLEVHVYDQRKGNLYVHHDIPLPAFPLCLAHGQIAGGSTGGNYCAVGTFNTGIEIWNLDVLNALEPTTVLGGNDTTYADDYLKHQMIHGAAALRGDDAAFLPPPKPSGNAELRAGSHTDAIMSLHWNTIHKQVLASGSADTTVKLWDTIKSEHATTFTHHRDKVQAVEWNPNEGTLLASGSYDRTVSLLDARNSTQKPKTVKIPADVEAMAWDPFHSERLTVAAEDGTMTCWDVRKFVTNQPLWSHVVNEYGGVNDFAYNTMVPDMLVTCSTDKTVTIWDAGADSSIPPKPCGKKDMCAGKLYTVGFYQSAPWLLACGGSGNQLSLWDLSSEDAIEKRFKERLLNAKTAAAIDTPTNTPEKFPVEDDTTDDNVTSESRTSSSKKKKKGKKVLKR